MTFSPEDRDTARRAAIVAAARLAFLRFGYAKTSIADIAKEARISRPLIYLQFKSKEEIFAALFESMFSQRYCAVEQILAQRLRKREKLERVYELLLLEPWDELMGMPGAAEFYESCQTVLAAEFADYERRRIRYTAVILKRKNLAELFSLAVTGLQSDIPMIAVLRRRLHLLVEQFVT